MMNVVRLKQRILPLAAGVTALSIFASASPALAAGGWNACPPGSPWRLGNQAKSVPETVRDTENLSTLFAAVGAAGIADALQTSDPITLFAPTDAAFGALPAGTVESLLLPQNKDQLVKILSYHVVAGRYELSDVIKATLFGPVQLTTLSGDPISVYRQGGAIMIRTPNGTARVLRTNIRATNGVIHTIDAVLLP